jgi:predicted HicB family RNase H-like nuclease
MPRIVFSGPGLLLGHSQRELLYITYLYSQCQKWLEKYKFCLYNKSMRKNKPGRPKSESGTKCDAMLVRLDPNEKQAFKEAAGIAGIPLSTWVRERLRRIAARELEEASHPVAFFSHLRPT